MIISTGRKLNNLKFDLEGCNKVDAIVTRIGKIVGKFGARVKKLELWGSKLMAEINEADLVTFLESSGHRGTENAPPLGRAKLFHCLRRGAEVEQIDKSGIV